jgi:hypothetical protein
MQVSRHSPAKWQLKLGKFIKLGQWQLALGPMPTLMPFVK